MAIDNHDANMRSKNTGLHDLFFLTLHLTIIGHIR